MDDLSFDELAAFVREYRRVPDRKKISPKTQFEPDLGITGDDGSDLIDAAEKRFAVTLVSCERGIPETFNLCPNEYLFHGEGWEFLPVRMTSLFRDTELMIRQFTVREFFEPVRKARVTLQ